MRGLLRASLPVVCIGFAAGSLLTSGVAAVVLYCNYEILVRANSRRIYEARQPYLERLTIDNARKCDRSVFEMSEVIYYVESMCQHIVFIENSPFERRTDLSFNNPKIWFDCLLVPGITNDRAGLIRYYEMLCSRYAGHVPDDCDELESYHFRSNKAQNFLCMTMAILALMRYFEAVQYDVPQETVGDLTAHAILRSRMNMPDGMSLKSARMYKLCYEKYHEVIRDYMAYIIIVTAGWLYLENGEVICE